MSRRVVTEVVLRADPERVWEHTVRPEHHVRWDLRFDEILFVDALAEGGDTHRLLYVTRLVPGIAIRGFGTYRDSAHLDVSAFTFDSDDPKSLMTGGKGVWTYLRQDDGTLLFRSVYDYDTRFGRLGAWVDRWCFRPLLCLATEYSFETLRRWLDEGQDPASRAGRLGFLRFAVPRLLGAPLPQLPIARGWLGNGTIAERP